jgi:hypothetical protein
METVAVVLMVLGLIGVGSALVVLVRRRAKVQSRPCPAKGKIRTAGDPVLRAATAPVRGRGVGQAAHVNNL